LRSRGSCSRDLLQDVVGNVGVVGSPFGVDSLGNQYGLCIDDPTRLVLKQNVYSHFGLMQNVLGDLDLDLGDLLVLVNGRNGNDVGVVVAHGVYCFCWKLICADMAGLECMETFDWDLEVDSLLDFKVLFMMNEDPDIRVIEAKHDTDVHMIVQTEIGTTPVQMIVNNLDAETAVGCPYFRVVMDKFGNDQPINFKLQSFFTKIGMSSLNARCRKALVIGLAALNNLESAISVPVTFCTTNIDPLDFKLDEVDLACLSPCAQHLHPAGSTLCDIAGLYVPYHVPVEVQWRIVSFLKHPVAAMVNEEIDGICNRYDMFLMAMWKIREPRIPNFIGSFYNVPCVQTTVSGATRPFLARPAWHPARLAYQASAS